MLTPRPYQIEGRDFLASRRFALLADEMRVGKTPQAILAALERKLTHIIVVCPAIAVEHWHREWRRWGGGAILPDLTVVSYGNARNNGQELLRKRYDLAIVDECHFAKNPEAQRTKLIYGKNGLGWCSDRMWVLSGTPAPKHAGELWPMLYAFGVVGMQYSDFTRRYCTWSLDNKITGTKVEHIPELRALLATIMLRRTRKQVAPDMPAIDFQFLTIKPDSNKDLRPPVAGWTDEQLEVWLNRNCNADRQNRVEVAMAKVPALVEEIVFAIENGLLKQTVVFGWHVEPLRLLTETLQHRGVRADMITGATRQAQRVAIQDDFRHNRLQVVGANILAAGTAIDLSAASHGYFLELDWVSGNNAQAANRLVSMDKKELVTFDVATWPGSVDDRIQKVLLRRVSELCKLY